MKILPLALVLLSLTACDRNSDVPSAEENVQLDEASNLLNEAPANLEAVDDSGLVASNETP